MKCEIKDFGSKGACFTPKAVTYRLFDCELWYVITIRASYVREKKKRMFFFNSLRLVDDENDAYARYVHLN